MDIPSPFTVQYDDIDLLKRFTGYIEKVVTYARIDYYRRQKHRRQEVPLDEIPPDSEPSEEDFLPINKNDFEFENDRHTSAFNQLNSLRRRILTLIFVEGLSGQETADKLNISVDYVYLQKHRALKALRNQLMDEEGENSGK